MLVSWIVVSLAVGTCALSSAPRESSQWSTQGGVDECGSQHLSHLPDGLEWWQKCVQAPVRCLPATEAQYKWAEIDPVERKQYPKPKLAILMMTLSNISNPSTWQRWLENADKSLGSRYSFHIHMRDRRKPFDNPEFEPYVLNSSVDARYVSFCKVAPIEWKLIKRALEDPTVSHLAMTSGDSVPVKPLEYMLKDLERQPATRLCFDWKYKRAETWFVMERNDAELFVRHQAYMDAHFRTGCEEENMWMFPMVLRSWRWGMEKQPLADDCPMFADWGTDCKEWASNANLGLFDNVRRQAHHHASPGHPRTYYYMSQSGAKELQESHFWFARKFTEQALPDGFAPWDV